MTVERRALQRFYVAGGTLEPEAPSYIERQADRELFELVIAGEFCWVLTTRQVGKSSLMARTVRRLGKEGVRTADIDLSQLGNEQRSVNADQWYFGMAHRVLRRGRIPLSLHAWWDARERLSPVQRFMELLEDIVLSEVKSRIVIFFDEIDSTIGLGFSDDFFAALRGCYNARATDPKWQRLSFVLLGVASPADLISDPTRTPFNIGREVKLDDFTWKEAQALAHGFGMEQAPAEGILRRILFWTDGHPFLTQALCRIASEPNRRDELKVGGAAFIDSLVEDDFIYGRATRTEANENLRFVSKRLTYPDQSVRRVLKTYLRIRKGQRVLDQPTSAVHATLKLSGVVKRGKREDLRVRNRIYEAIFTPHWVKTVMPSDRSRWLFGSASATAIVILAVWYAILLPRSFIRNLQTASQDVRIAYENYDKLRRMPFFSARADALLALFWERRGDRDHALLTRLQIAARNDNLRHRSQAAHLIGPDYQRLLATCRHSDTVNAVAFSPDGTTLLTGSADNTARLWDANTGSPRSGQLKHWETRHEREREGAGSVDAVAFSPDGTKFLTGSSDFRARVWDLVTVESFYLPEHSIDAVGRPEPLRLEHQDWVRAVAFSSDGMRVVTGSDDGAAQIWDVAQGTRITPPLRHQGAVSAVAFSSDGALVLTGSWDNTAQVWDAATGELRSPSLPHRKDVLAVAFSSDGTRVLTIDSDDIATVWSAASGTPLTPPFEPHAAVHTTALSVDVAQVLTGSETNAARVWNAETGERLLFPQHHATIRAVAFSPGGHRLLTGSDDGAARVWNVNTDKPRKPPLRQDLVRTVAFSPDGKSLVSGGDVTASVWAAETGERRSRLSQHVGAVRAVAFSPDGDRVLTGSDDGTARLWGARTGEPQEPPLRHEDAVNSVAFSPDGGRVLTTSDDGTAQLWDTTTGEPLVPPFQHEDVVSAAAFNHEGTMVLTGSWDGVVRLWEVETGKRLNELVGHQDSVRTVVFSPDSMILLSGGDDGTARLWDAKTGEPRVPPMTHPKAVSAVVFSSDGKNVLTGSWDGTVRVWDAESGELGTQPLQHQGAIRAIILSRKGDHFFCATDHWLTYYRSTPKPRPVAVRLLRGTWAGAFRLPEGCDSCLEVALTDIGNTVLSRTLDFNRVADPPFTNNPQDLLHKWQQRLALRIDSRGRISPMWPVSDHDT